jgi:hypothetical protein
MIMAESVNQGYKIMYTEISFHGPGNLMVRYNGSAVFLTSLMTKSMEGQCCCHGCRRAFAKGQIVCHVTGCVSTTNEDEELDTCDCCGCGIKRVLYTDFVQDESVALKHITGQSPEFVDTMPERPWNELRGQRTVLETIPEV